MWQQCKSIKPGYKSRASVKTTIMKEMGGKKRNDLIEFEHRMTAGVKHSFLTEFI